MEKTIEIPEGYEARIEGNKVILEQKENEDEKTRQGLLSFIRAEKKYTPETVPGEHWDRWIAYLERQKYKEKYDRMAPIYEDKESFESALDKAWKFYNESASATVDGFEDNFRELTFAKGFREGFLYKEKQKGQKHAEWSDEDEKMLEAIVNDIHCGTDFNAEVMHEANRREKWLRERLKSLRPQLHWKPSEEDEKMREHIISDLREFRDCETDEELIADYEDEIQWLKSLRPNHWKPSEE